uniref:NEDD8-activating enzyme E1 catalytic subunit n=1 Tax=Trichuris muris TaxID=70415 RepID=A0A5S6QWK0_TRIMR
MHKRWSCVRKLLERSGPLAHPEFVPSSENIELIHSCKVLVVGAGGLGCELLKDLALSGFHNIHVIDMDTIELSNLNRQFLFRENNVGASKAVTAAEAIRSRVPGCNVTPHFCRIEDKDSSFYQDFNVIVSGLDSIAARRWINNMLVRLLRYNEDGSLDTSSVIPLVDGGVEGFKGNVRVVLPGISPCIECYVDLYPLPVTYPICTISNTPRSPEHCIEYARLVSWVTEHPFEGKSIDGDNPMHINWIYEKALERASSFGIAGVTYRLTQGVVKRIIPAVASSNAVVAAACALEVFKLASCCALPIKNYMSLQDAEGIYMKTLELERRDDCRVCGQKDILFEIEEDAHLDDIRVRLVNHPVYHLKDPSFSILDPSPRILYFPAGMGVAESTEGNLSKTLKELGLQNDDQLHIGDASLQSELVIRLKFILIPRAYVQLPPDKGESHLKLTVASWSNRMIRLLTIRKLNVLFEAFKLAFGPSFVADTPRW